MTEKTHWMRHWIVIITFTFFFSTLILNNFQRHFDYNDVNVNPRSSLFNTNLDVCVCVCVCVCEDGCLCVGGGSVVLPLCWFSYNNLEKAKALILAFCNIQ